MPQYLDLCQILLTLVRFWETCVRSADKRAPSEQYSATCEFTRKIVMSLQEEYFSLEAEYQHRKLFQRGDRVLFLSTGLNVMAKGKWLDKIYQRRLTFIPIEWWNDHVRGQITSVFISKKRPKQRRELGNVRRHSSSNISSRPSRFRSCTIGSSELIHTHMSSSVARVAHILSMFTSALTTMLLLRRICYKLFQSIVSVGCKGHFGHNTQK